MIRTDNSQPVCPNVTSYYEAKKRVEVDFQQINRLQTCDTVLVDLIDTTAILVMDTRQEETLFSVMKLKTVQDTSGYGLLVYRGGDTWDEHGVLIGDFRFAGKSYELKKCGMGSDRSSYFMGAIDTLALTTFNQGSHTGTGGGSMAGKNCELAYGSGVIDVLILYTDSAMIASGGRLETEAEIILAMEKTNEAFSKSNLNVRLHLSHIAEHDTYDNRIESGTNSMHDKIQLAKDDLVMLNLREKFQADICLLYVKNANNVDQGYSLQHKALGMLRISTAAQRYLMAHEVGHLLIGDRHQACAWKEGNRFVQNVMGNEAYERMPFFAGGPNGCQDAGLREAFIKAAQDVSAYRCPNFKREALIQDFFGDEGYGYSISANSPGLFSPHLYIRKRRDRNRVHLYDTENPVQGDENYLYVMVRNGSNRIVKGAVSAYYYKSTLTPLKLDLKLIERKKDVLIPPGSVNIVEFTIPDSTPGVDGAGFLAQWHRQLPAIPILPTKAPVQAWVTESNQVSARSAKNVKVRNQLASSAGAPMVLSWTPCMSADSIKFLKDLGDQVRIRFGRSEETGNTFLADGGTLTYSLGEGMSEFWIEGDTIMDEANLEARPMEERIIQYEAEEVPATPEGEAMIFLRFCPPTVTQEATYPVHLELLNGETVIGSYTYLLETDQ